MRVLFLSENIMNPEIIPHKYNYDVAIFPWDKIFFEENGYGLSRLAFMYEYLCSREGVEVYLGSVEEIVKDISAHTSISHVLLPCPKCFCEIGSIPLHASGGLVGGIPASYYRAPMWLDCEKQGYKRFHKYWGEVKDKI